MQKKIKKMLKSEMCGTNGKRRHFLVLENNGTVYKGADGEEDVVWQE